VGGGLKSPHTPGTHARKRVSSTGVGLAFALASSARLVLSVPHVLRPGSTEFLVIGNPITEIVSTARGGFKEGDDK
jgi:hypothetical protein